MRSYAIKLLALVLLTATSWGEPCQATSLEYVSSTLWTGMNDVICRDNYVFAAFQYGLQVFDITNPSSPVLVSQLYIPPGGFAGLATEADYLYLAATTGGVAIVDISQPTSPRLISWCKTPGSAVAVAARGGYLYVADSWAGLQIINATNPESPFIEGSYDTPGDGRDVALYGDFALIADGYDGGIQVINVVMPQIPYPAAQFNTEGIARGIAVEGQYAYVADAEGGVVILDLTDPITPIRKSVFPPLPARGYAGDIAISGNAVYYTSGSLKILDVSDPQNPQIIDTLSEAGYCSQVVQSSGHLFAWQSSRGLTILDPQNPFAPIVNSEIRIPGGIDHVVMCDSVLIAGDEPIGLYIVNVTNPSNPEHVSFIPALNRFYGVASYLNYLYVADSDSGTRIIDMTDPRNPLEAERLWSTIRDMQVCVSSGYLSVSGYDAGNTFYRLDDPIHPTKIGTFLASYSARSGCDGTHGYVATAYSGLQIVNFVDSGVPFREGLLPGSYNDIVLDSPYAYLANDRNGLAIVDISNPAQPVKIGQYGASFGSTRVMGVAHQGNLAFIAADAGGVWAIDITNPALPFPVALYDTPGNAIRLTVSGDYVYVADTYGVVVLKIANPTAVHDNNMEALPRHMILAQNYPNPFNPQTHIAFALPQRARVELTIFNALGQKVVTLVDRELSAGEHSVVWDGRDAHETAVSSGVYFYRISTPGATDVRKMLLLK